MSSVNDCIKFDLDIKDKNIVFYNNFYKFFNGVQYKVYEALLKQPTCPFCGFPAEKITITIYKSSLTRLDFFIN